VLEDWLLTEAAVEGTRRFRARPMTILLFVSRLAWRKLRGRFAGFGAASAGFGAPLSLRQWQSGAAEPTTEALGADLMARIAHSVPVLPVPLVAAALVDGLVTREELGQRLADLTTRLRGAGMSLRLPPEDKLLEEGLRPLVMRKIVQETEAGLIAAPEAAKLLNFYAGPVLQGLEDAKSDNAATRRT
jgi:glycerol-3-phosphate O-acyltransferase